MQVSVWGEGGDKWSQPRTIFSQEAEGGTPKVLANKMIVLSTGEWVLPFWREYHPVEASRGCGSREGNSAGYVHTSTRLSCSLPISSVELDKLRRSGRCIPALSEY